MYIHISFPDDAFSRRGYRFRNGNSPDGKNPWRVPGSYNEHIQRGSFTQSFRYRGWVDFKDYVIRDFASFLVIHQNLISANENVLYLAPYSETPFRFIVVLCKYLCFDSWFLILNFLSHSGAIQRNIIGSPARREHGWDVLHRQRSFVRHMFSYIETTNSYIRGFESFGVCNYEWCYYLSQISWWVKHFLFRFRDILKNIVWRLFKILNEKKK